MHDDRELLDTVIILPPPYCPWSHFWKWLDCQKRGTISGVLVPCKIVFPSISVKLIFRIQLSELAKSYCWSLTLIWGWYEAGWTHLTPHRICCTPVSVNRALSGHFIRYTCTIYCTSIHSTSFYFHKVSNVQFLTTLSEVCKFDYVFIIEVMVKGGLHYIERCFKFFVCPIYKQNIRNLSEYNSIQCNNTTNYELNAKTYNIINTSTTVSTKTEHYRHHKSRLYGRTVVLDCIRLHSYT